MRSGPQRTVSVSRQVILLVVAVTVPSVVIVMLGLRLLAQERELSEKQSADRRRQVIAEVRQELLTRLGQIILGARPAAQGERAPDRAGLIVAVMPVRGGQMVPPWEPLPDRQAIEELESAALVETKRPLQAAELYERAMRSANPVVVAHARFALARALARAGRNEASDALNVRIAEEPFTMTDEYGTPLAVYAAQRLARRGAALPPAFTNASLQAIAPEQWPSPGVCYALEEIAVAATASPHDATRAWARAIGPLAQRRAADAERLLSLQQEIVEILPRAQGSDEPRWIITGTPAWLVSVARSRSDETLVIVVDAAGLVRSLPAVPGAANVRLVTAREAGEPLGDEFPGIRLAFDPIDTVGEAAGLRLRRLFFIAVLTLVVAVTSLGVFLLWRDVRRESRVSALRAQFVASVSHELKTPLTSIRMFAETLRMRPDLEDSSRIDSLNTIITESERLTRLLNNVLAFSRIEQEKKIYTLAPVDLREVVSASARAIEYPLMAEGFDLQMTLDAVPPMEADADAIQQAVLNLLTNAMKYSGASRRIALSLTNERGAVVITVTDYGHGIRPEDLPRLFERFYRAPTVENQYIPGTGLGLTIVQHIAEAHGGTVSVASDPGQGTTFAIRLPIPTPVLAGPPRMAEVKS